MNTTTPLPASESNRLKSLRDLVVLDSPPEPVFDTIARLASEVCGAPIALMSLVDDERQWFKANIGLPGVNETPRDVAFCAHAILGDGLFEVPDARRDPRFAANPLVTGAPGIQFYAGSPLVLPDGERIGTLCVIDHQARQLSPAQASMLQSLAAIASQTLVMRRDLIVKSLSVRTGYEQKLADSEARYRTIVEDQNELVSLAQADGELVYVNKAYAQHFGMRPDDMVGANLFDFIEPADWQAVRAQVAEVFRSGTRQSGENRMMAADGTERWVAWTNSLQRDEQGQPMLHSVGRDVTDRKRAEAALHASQSLLARTGRVAGVGGWELDIASGAITWSDETRRIHEVHPDYVPTLEEGIAFYAPQARPVILRAVQVGIESGEPWDLELPFITATGRHIWVRAVGEVEFDNQVAVRLVGAFQDITQRKRLEQRLVENEGFVRQITDGLPLRIAYVDREQRFRFVNRAHCLRFGRDRDDILGRTRGELTRGLADAKTDAELQQRVQAVLGGEAQKFEYEETLHGELRRIESQLIPDVSESGEVRGYFSTGIDITERTAAGKALRVLNTIFDNTTDYVVQTDSRGRVTYMNPAVRQAAGLAADQAVEQLSFSEFNTAATNKLYAEEILPAVKASGVWLGETTVYVAHRREIPVSHMVIAHRDALGQINHYSAVMRDISAEVEAKQLLLRQTATLRSMIEVIPAVVAVIGADGRYRFVNSAFERWNNRGRDSIVGHTLIEVLGQAEYEARRPWIERVLAGETVTFDRAHAGPGNASHMFFSYVPLRADNGSVDGFVAMVQDVTDHKREEGRLLQLAQRDPLTGLLNRAGFQAYLEQGMQDDGGHSLALLYIDLDHFKPVNDRYGHPAGDQLLQVFGQRLLRLVRPTDAVARLGGDEFALALAGVPGLANVQSVADKVIAEARAPFDLGALQVAVGASVGIALGVTPGLGWQDLVERADAMLYQAKKAGRGRHAGAEPRPGR